MKIKDSKNLGSEVEKMLIEFDMSPDVASEVSANINATVENYIIMGVEEINQAEFLAVLLKDLLRY